MRQATPLFNAFGALLFGKPDRCALSNLLDSLKGSSSISQLQGTFGHLIPQARLAREKQGENSRNRFFPPTVTFWAFLAQVLARGSSCRDALRRIQAWWQFESPKAALPSSDTSAYCAARRRLNEKAINQISSHLADHLESKVTASDRWKNRVVKIVDGTGVSMPDTEANQEKWPQSRLQKTGCGFPTMKLIGLFSLASGALLELAHGSKHDSEIELMRELRHSLKPDDILLTDRGFCSFTEIAAMLARGVDCVMRQHQRRAVDFQAGRKLGPDDRLLEWQKPETCPKSCTKEEFAALPARLVLRMLRYRVKVAGFRTRQVVLITTLIDPALYPKEDLAELYFRRWNVELYFREIKTLLGLDILRCLTPEMIRKELVMHQIAYNLVRTLMQQAALTYHVALKRLSFKGALDSLHHFAAVIHAATGKPRKQAQLLNALLQSIAMDLLPERPGRCEPRAKKRRPKGYQVLTKPRRKMRESPHRGNPKPKQT
jgi:hypothetical protein